ncbi:MAG: serine/threonine protein kinase [Verrucomicrobiota bacterium]
MTLGDFAPLTPDTILDAVETAACLDLASYAHPLNSYINRVYELMQKDGTRFIAKFYRPGRWSRAAVEEEHRFVIACAEADIPAVAPTTLADGQTVGETDTGIFFAVFPKRRGREWEAIDDEAWQRLGSLVGRIHAVGAEEDASHRPILHPAHSAEECLNELLAGGIVTDKHRDEFADFAKQARQKLARAFEKTDPEDYIRLHGDCHQGNILHRPGEGLVVIDFDDMAMGPTVQDLWMLLPDTVKNCRREINLILEGYEMFREFDDAELRLVEALRLMRMLYFLAWVGRQRNDPGFARHFPGWGEDAFWRRELAELSRQLAAVDAG